MSSIQRLVSPKLPTALENHTHVDLAGQDTRLYYGHGVHVIPAKLDLTKFEDALSRVLQLYPHAAGHIRHTEGRWSIELANSGIPLDVDYSPEVDPESFLDGDWVIQDNFSPLLCQQPIGTELVNGNAPLIRFKITFFNDETYIGASWNHSLGDGITEMRFMHTLSQFYQGLPAEFAAPTFKQHQFPSPSDAVVAQFSSHLPLLPRTLDDAASDTVPKDFSHVRWRIDAHDLEVLRSILCSDKPDGKFLSRQDCLVAYIIVVLNSSRSSPIQKVTNTSSYRHVKASFATESLAGNLVLYTTADVPTDIAGIAAAVREARIQSRQPHYIHNIEMLKSKDMLSAASARKRLPFLSTNDDTLLVNSYAVFDWHSLHFGYPDGTRGYIGGTGRYLLKCSKSNPVRGDDGVWRERQSMDISIGVPIEVESKVLGTLARGVRYMLDGRSARL